MSSVTSDLQFCSVLVQIWSFFGRDMLTYFIFRAVVVEGKLTVEEFVVGSVRVVAEA